jgi:acyl-CoA synthetase (AMP-forming)/AMP-acid ligase II
MSWTPTPLYAFVAERADTRGDAQALVTTTARLNYRDQHAAVRRAAKAMYALGVRRGDFIGILMGNSEIWVTLFYAAATIGAVTVPINTRFKSAELAFCLAQADVKVLFAADRFLNIDFLSFLRAAEPAIDHALPGDALPLLHGVVVVGSEIPRAGLRFDAFLALGEDITDDVLDRLAAQVQPSDLLLIQFTSGTTAYPKAVMLTHDNMLRNAWAVGQRMGIRPDDRYFNCRPFFHVAGTTLSLLVALVARRLPHHAADVRGRSGASHDGAGTLHADLRKRHPVPAHDGSPELRPGPTVSARRLGSGGSGDDPQHHRENGRARDLHGLWIVRSIAQCRAQRSSRSVRPAHRRAGEAA